MHKRTVSLLGLVLAGLGALVLLGPQNAQIAQAQPASRPAAAGTIAYVVGNDAGDQIWLVEPDGSNNHKIYSTGVADTQGYITSLAWRPDAGELVFTSNYEEACSWYRYDVYAIYSDGSSYRRVTNSPACAALGTIPQGPVSLDVSAIPAEFQIYVQGAPMVKSASGTTLTFDHVADFGGRQQPIEIIDGEFRGLANAYVKFQAGQPVPVSYPLALATSMSDNLGAYSPVWKSDGSRIAYSFGCVEMRGIADRPAPGDYGQGLFGTDNSTVRPCVMAYGPTASTANQIVYAGDTEQASDTEQTNFYLTSENGGVGKLLINGPLHKVFQIQWLPDASGFIYAMVDSGYSSNLYRYDFAGDTITQLTHFGDTREYARDFSISPDGKTIVFERAPETLMDAFGGPADLWTIGIDGSNPQLLVKGGAHPTWSLATPYVPAPVPGPNPTSGTNKLFIPFVRR